MKKNLSKILGLILTLTLVFGIMAIPVSAETMPEIIYVGGVEMGNGDYLASGATEVSSEAPAEGGYAYYADGVLTLNDYVYEGEGYIYYSYEDTEDPDASYFFSSAIYSPISLTIELVGDSSITNTAVDSDGITCDSNLKIDGDGTISIFAAYGIYNDVYNAETAEITVDDGCVYIFADYDAIYLCSNDGDGLITVNGGSIVCESHYGIIALSYAEFGIAAICVSGGEIIADCTSGLVSYSSSGTSDICINEGYVSVTSINEALNADKIYVNGGIVYAEATADDGIAIYGELNIRDDDVVIVNGSIDGAYLETHFTYYAGDANGDKVIDMFDYLLIKGIYFESVDYSYEEFVRADANCDGLVDMFDYLVAKTAYFTGEEPELLPEVDAPTPDTETAYTKLYNYIVENGVANEDMEGIYDITSDPVIDADTSNFTICVVEANTSDESIQIGGVYSTGDASQMLVVAILLEPDTVTFNLMAAYISSDYNEFYTGTVTAGGCVAGEIDIQNFSGNAVDDTPLETIELVCETVLNNSLAIAEELIAPSGVSLADFGFDCFAEPI